MDIIIDKQLRELRVKHGNTQEDLASFLNISYQAVSKWERGESIPDTVLLPRIAAYYNVTVDDLLGVGEIRKKEIINSYKEKGKEFYRVGKIDELITIWRKACEEFPNDLECQGELMDALHFWFSNEKTDETIDEIIAIGEKILKESTDSYLRDRATQILVLNLPGRGRFDEAREYAKNASDVYITSNVLLSHINCSEDKFDEGKRLSFSNITTYLELISKELYYLCCYDRGNYERYISLHELYLKLYDLIFDDGFYGFYNAYIKDRHYWLAKLYTNIRGDEIKAREHLEAAAKCAVDFDNLPDKFVHKATIFGDSGWEYSMDNTSRNYTKSCAQILLHEFDGSGLMDSAFDRWRDRGWFKEIVEKLEKDK